MFDLFCGGQSLEQELINILQMKVYICCKMLSNCMQIQKRAFKKTETEDEKIIGKL